MGINGDKVDDLGNKDALHLNDGLANNEDTVDDGVQHKQDNQHSHFGGLIENKEQQNNFGAPNQDNRLYLVLLSKITNFWIILLISTMMMMMMMLMKSMLYQRIRIVLIVVLMITMILMMDAKAINLKRMTTQTMNQVIRRMI